MRGAWSFARALRPATLDGDAQTSCSRYCAAQLHVGQRRSGRQHAQRGDDAFLKAQTAVHCLAEAPAASPSSRA